MNQAGGESDLATRGGLAAGSALDEERLRELEHPVELISCAAGWTTRRKAAAGLRGLKRAIRGNSSFFAYGFRGTLVALFACVLGGVSPLGWCLLILAGGLVLVAELAHSAVDTLASAIGERSDPRLQAARDIANGGVLVAAFAAAAITAIILSGKIAELIAATR